MKLPFELFLALRYLRPKRTFVSVITLISVLGVMLGVAVLIIVISVMSGFSKELQDKILGFNAHIKVFQKGNPLEDFESTRTLVSNHPKVTGVAPFIMGPVLMETQHEGESPQLNAPYIKGIDPASEKTVSNLHTNIIAGSSALSDGGILLGWEMAKTFRLSVGDKIVIHSRKGLERMRKTRGTEDEELHVPLDYEIRGIFDVGYFEYNSAIIVTSLETAQELYDIGSAVHGLVVMIKDPFEASQVRDELEKQLGHNYEFTIWSEEHEGILTALMVEKSVMFYLLFFIMIVAAFGIMNSLITFVVQKTHDIGMLKALGATRSQIVKLFLGQSLIVGFLGVMTGLGAGMLALIYRNPFLHTMNKLTGFELFPADIYGFRNLPALIVPGDIALICGSAIVTCILAGAIPAWIASRMQPVEALRYD